MKNEKNYYSWIVFIEEAAPERCPDFCEYIESEMKKKGYDVKVITEW